MRAQRAAPRELAGKLRGDATLHGNACSKADLGFAAHVVDLLHREGVHDLDDWRQLRIFGIVPPVARMLDAAARELYT